MRLAQPDRQGNYTGTVFPLTPGNWHACSDYGGMFGAGLLLPYANGTMLYDRSIAIRQISDGTSHTIIVAEDTGRGNNMDGEWADGENIFDQTEQINQLQDNESLERSSQRRTSLDVQRQRAFPGRYDCRQPAFDFVHPGRRRTGRTYRLSDFACEGADDAIHLRCFQLDFPNEERR